MEIHIKKGLDALQTETVLRLLSQTVWACNRKKEAIMESWKHSICYGAYTADGKQIGFARVITDYATQYYICDVVVDADFRHRGVGASLLKAITAEDTYRSLLGMLITEEAEQFYEPFGFRKDPICFMTRKETPEAITNETSVYKGYKQDKIEMRGDRAEMSDFPLYLNTVAGGLDRRDQTIGGFSFVVKIYAVPVVEIIG